MARTHLGVVAFALALIALLGMGSCAAPTQIVLEIFTDACPGSGKPEVVQSTAVAVGTAEDIDSQRPASTHVGCETATGIGTITIYPSGSKNDAIAIKVLGGVESSPDRCDPPGYAGCIVDQREMRFIPNVTQRVTVVLSLACLNRECPTGTTCSNGDCVSDHDVLADGGTAQDAEVTEASTVPPITDAAPPPDAADPCIGCAGTCDRTTCSVDCTKVACTGQVCAPTLPCVVSCQNANNCPNVSCVTSSTCAISCDGSNACGVVSCTADQCDVSCGNTDSCNLQVKGGPGPSITVNGKTKASVECNDTKSCDKSALSCTSDTSCTLTCTPNFTQGGNDACPQNLANTCHSTFAVCAGWHP